MSCILQQRIANNISLNYWGIADDENKNFAELGQGSWRAPLRRKQLVTFSPPPDEEQGGEALNINMNYHSKENLNSDRQTEKDRDTESKTSGYSKT